MLLLTQNTEIVREVSVWPDDVLGWLTLIAVVITVVAGTIGVVIKILNKRFVDLEQNKASKEELDGMGKRVDDKGERLTTLEATMKKVEWDVQKLYLENQANRDNGAELREMHKELAKHLETQRKDSAAELRVMADNTTKMRNTVDNLGTLFRDVVQRGGRS